MEDHYIKNFKKLWSEHSILFHDLNFQIIYKILSSDKLKNENPQTVWQVMHDWMKVDIFNRLTYFKILFKKCLQIESLQFQFVENNIFQSDIFRLLPLEFQQNLKKFIINTKSLLVCINKINGSTQFYDPKNHIWHSSIVSIPLADKQNYFQLSLLGRTLYVFGGRDKNRNATKQMWSRDLSDPSPQWTARADMKQSRIWFASVVLNDTIYALGGRDYYNHYLRSCERYCSQLKEWSRVADMNSDRAYASAAVINGYIYVAGGRDDKEVFKSVSKYCPETDTWREVAPMTTQRTGFALTPFVGRLWAIGGMGGSGGGYSHPLSSCESYDPVTDTWQEEAEMKEGRCEHAAIEFNGELYVVGGLRNKDLKVVEKYVPTIGWVEDSQLSLSCYDPRLLIIPPACTSFFTN